MSNIYTWQGTVQNATGDAQPTATIEVRSTGPGTPLATIYSDGNGAALVNPFTVDPEGFGQFWAQSGEYTVKATVGADTQTWTVQLGDGAITYNAFSDIKGDALTYADGTYARTLQPLATWVTVASDGDFTNAGGQHWNLSSGPMMFATKSDMLADANTGYPVGLAFRASNEGENYTVADASAVDHNEVTAGGVKLYRNDPVATQSSSLRMRKTMLLNTGFGAGELFPGASGAPQGFAIADLNGTKTAFLLQHTVHDSYKATERQTIVAADYRLDGQDPADIDKTWSNQLAVGHQGLSAVSNGDGTVTLYSGQTTDVAHEDDDSGKGFTKIEWRGALTDQTDVTSYQLFGYQGSGHRFEEYNKATPGVDPSGKYLVLVASRNTERVSRLFIYDLAEVLAAPDPLLVDPLVSEIEVDNPPSAYGYATQGVAAGPDHIAILRGFNPARGHKWALFYDYSGRKVSELDFDGSRGLYTEDELLSHVTLGVPYSVEPEGAAWDGSGRFVSLFYDVWRDAGDVVSFGGKNFACVTETSLNRAPGRANNHWVVTDLAAGGAWDSTTTYNRGAAYTQKDNAVMVIEAPLASGGDLPLLAGNADPLSGATDNSVNAPYDYTVGMGWDFKVGSYNEQTGEYRNLIEHTSDGLRIYNDEEGQDNARFLSITLDTDGGNDRAIIRNNNNSNTSGAVVLTNENDGIGAGMFATIYNDAKAALETVFRYKGSDGVGFIRNNVNSIAAIEARDATTGGNASPTTPTGYIHDIGGMVHVNLRFAALDTTGMTGTNNLYIGTLPFAPSVETPLCALSASNVDFATGVIYAMAVVDTGGRIFIREVRDNNTYLIADVSQFTGATFTVSGVYSYDNAL